MKFALPLAALVFCMMLPAQSAGPKFEVASIKPDHTGGGRAGIALEPGGRFVATNVPVKMLITMSYQLKESQLSGLPAWADSDRFDIVAKPESGAGVTSDDIRAMVRAMLGERFQLTMQKETKELPIYALVVAKGGPKLEASKGNADLFGDPDGGGRRSEPSASGRGGRGVGIRMGRGEITAANVTVGMIADQLSNILSRTVVDKTGLTGSYDFKLRYTPEMMQGPPPAGAPDGARAAEAETAPSSDAAPSIFVAVQEQLGLKLEPQKGPVDIYVIDRLEKPSEN